MKFTIGWILIIVGVICFFAYVVLCKRGHGDKEWAKFIAGLFVIFATVGIVMVSHELFQQFLPSNEPSGAYGNT